MEREVLSPQLYQSEKKKTFEREMTEKVLLEERSCVLPMNVFPGGVLFGISWEKGPFLIADYF
jgi:hypothetical protein